jgi:hypothetical protein
MKGKLLDVFARWASGKQLAAGDEDRMGGTAMSSAFALLEIACDAPSYEIVRACERVGFSSPLDVRWCRVDHVAMQRGRWWRLLRNQPWQALLSLVQLGEPRCGCGHALPDLRYFEFKFLGGGQADLLIGQCPRCRSMFWKEAEPTP